MRFGKAGMKRPWEKLKRHLLGVELEGRAIAARQVCDGLKELDAVHLYAEGDWSFGHSGTDERDMSLWVPIHASHMLSELPAEVQAMQRGCKATKSAGGWKIQPFQEQQD